MSNIEPYAANMHATKQLVNGKYVYLNAKHEKY